MARSRSSFDLTGAIATAASLSSSAPPGAPEEVPVAYRGVALVSFETTPAKPLSAPPLPALPPWSDRTAHSTDRPASDDATRRPPRLPDLSKVLSPTERCNRILSWIVEAVGAEEVFIADAAGLPMAGAVTNLEARLAAGGVVVASVAHLAASIPGQRTSLFELHLGEGPFFQLIGFDAGAALYFVGLTRATPLSYRQAHAVRLACRHALADPTMPSPRSEPAGGMS